MDCACVSVGTSYLSPKGCWGGRCRGERGKGLEWNVIFNRRDKSQGSIITGKTRTDGRTDRRTFSCLWVVSHRKPYTLFSSASRVLKEQRTGCCERIQRVPLLLVWYVHVRVSGAEFLRTKDLVI